MSINVINVQQFEFKRIITNVRILYLAGSAFTLARFLNSSSMGVTLSPGSVCIRFWMCWWRLRAGTSVFPDNTACQTRLSIIYIFMFTSYCNHYLLAASYTDHNNLMNKGLLPWEFYKNREYHIAIHWNVTSEYIPCPQKNLEVRFLAISQLLIGQIPKVWSVLKSACSEDFKTLLTFDIWPSRSWDNGG